MAIILNKLGSSMNMKDEGISSHTDIWYDKNPSPSLCSPVSVYPGMQV